MKELSVKKVFNNGLISIFFQGVPILLALICTPYNIKYLGDNLWGLYSLAVTILFLFMYFNIGINPSINKKLSELLGCNSSEMEIHKLLSNGFYYNLVSSVFLGIIIFLMAPVIAQYVLSQEQNQYYQEAVNIFRLSGIVGTFSLLISFFRNVYESRQRFYLVSILRIILSSSLLVTPTIGIMLGIDLTSSFYIILLTYILVCSIYFKIYLSEYKFPDKSLLETKIFKDLIFFGIWITGYSLINPVFLHLDRFIISNELGLENVAFYTTPYDLVSKMSLISGSITGAFFPAISYWYSKNDMESLKKSLNRTLLFLFVILFCIGIVLIIIAPLFLELWIGEVYKNESTQVFRILVVAYFVSSFNIVFLRFIYGIGIPKYAFFINLAMVPIYMIILLTLVKVLGIEGAAYAFLIKVILDFCLLYYIVKLKLNKIN